MPVDGVNSIALTGDRSPYSVTITNTGDFDSNAYAFTGTGAITGSTGIIRERLGNRKISDPNNSYSGTLAINAGAVIKDVADSSTGNITVANRCHFRPLGRHHRR